MFMVRGPAREQQGVCGKRRVVYLIIPVSCRLPLPICTLPSDRRVARHTEIGNRSLDSSCVKTFKDTKALVSDASLR